MNTIIATGGKIDIRFAKAIFKNNKYDFIIAADKGLSALERLDVIPDYIIGDFDSVQNSLLKSYKKERIIKLDVEKDFTDTEAAVRFAIENGASSIDIIGAAGTRLDHTVSNIGTLMLPLKAGIPAFIRDSHNRVRLINKSVTFERTECLGDNISLIPYTEEVIGVTLTGFFYPLTDKTLSIYEEPSLGISNKITEDKCTIELKKGILILIESKD